jgi:hypothetical protein
MARKATGAKRGRKTNISPEQTEFLQSYSECFKAGTAVGTLYSEVANAWLEKFGYDGLPEYGKNAIWMVDFRPGEVLENMAADEREKVIESREAARQSIRQVRRLCRLPVDCRTDVRSRKSAIGSAITIATEKHIRRALMKFCKPY